MFIQIFESGTSQQNHSVWKIQFVRYNQQQKAFCARDGCVCESMWTGILSKHKGMTGELQDSSCPIALCLADSFSVIINFLQCCSVNCVVYACIQNDYLLDRYNRVCSLPCLFNLYVFYCVCLCESYGLCLSPVVENL